MIVEHNFHTIPLLLSGQKWPNNHHSDHTEVTLGIITAEHTCQIHKNNLYALICRNDYIIISQNY